MIRFAACVTTWFVCLVCSVSVLVAQENKPEKPFGISERIAWNTSRITGSPEPPPPYQVEQVFPKLKFANPVILTSAPGTDRMFVVELKGKVFSFLPGGDDEKAHLTGELAPAIDGFNQVYGLTFHPRFAENRYCYIAYVKKAGLDDGTVVSRFKCSDTDPPTIDVKSEEVIITWLSGGHNGACIKFGPDGYLYITAGDGAGAFPPDSLRNGQNIGTLMSTIMRIDVDHHEDDKLYSIPQDNPFVNRPGARGEVWAYGFRNPWKIAFDPTNGALWCGDVGWEMWEMVYRVEKGANYGWSIVEASQSVHPEWDRGPTKIVPATVAHSHTEARSITGGAVYVGERLQELKGAYVYADYVTGKVWGVRHDGKKVTWLKELVDTPLQVICFGTDHDDELYMMDYVGGTLHRLVPTTAATVNQEFPEKLSETGLFASVEDHQLAPGVIPYSINAEPWADHAIAERFVGLPGMTQLGVYKKSNAQQGFFEGNWAFPKDGVLAKTVSLEMRKGDPKSRRRIETQILHFDGNAWQAYNYIWNGKQTDARLAGHEGTDRTFTVEDPSAPGGRRQQRWHHASRTECILCHTTRGGSIYGFTIDQVNREHDYGAVTDNQLRTLNHIGLFSEPLADQLPTMPNPLDESADLEQRARAYLHINCATCHRRGGGGTAHMDIRYALTLDKSNLLGARPTQGTFGIYGARVLAPADPYRSVLLYRMAKLGRGRMPHFGSQVVDRPGLQLVHDWIDSLSQDLAPAGTADKTAQEIKQRHRGLVMELGQESLGLDRRTAIITELLESSSGALQLVMALGHHQRPIPEQARKEVIQAGSEHADVRIRDLFESFVPVSQRVQRLGTVIRPDAILARSGSATAGRELFLKGAGVQCRNCHRVAGQGNQLGPDLDGIAKKNDRRALLETILEPSRKIDPKYRTYLVETVQGQVYTGLLASRTDQEVVLRDATRKEIRIAAKDVDLLTPQPKSLMPELLLKDMTLQQVADLLAFLASLK